MNGVALLVALSALGVDHSWRQTADGQVEYVLQVEPVFLQALAEGKEIHSLLPDEIERVDRLCIRVGSGGLESLPKTAPDWPELHPPAEQQAANSLPPEAPLGIYVKANGDAYESYHLAHGWRATDVEQATYLVQLDPQFLSQLAEGDELYAAIRPEAGTVRAFKLTAGIKPLPREGGKSPVMTVAQLQDAGTRANSPAADGLPTSDFTGGQSIYGGTATPATELGNVPSTAPPGYGFGRRDGAGNQPLAGSPEASRAADAPLLEVPQFDGNQFSRSRDSSTSQSADMGSPDNRRRRAAGNNAAPRSTSQQQSFPAPRNELYAEEDYAVRDNERNEQPPARVAARTTAAPTFDDELTGSASRRASRDDDEGEPRFPPFWIAVCIFALFFSIGGNFYLAWTAAEFYSRYKLAVERLRSAGR